MEVLSIQPFLEYFGKVRERTMRVARCVPADTIDWSFPPGKFTIGDILRHIAVAERCMFAENIQGHGSRYTSHGKELADGRDNILVLMERLHGESMEIFAELSDADLRAKCGNPGGVEIAKGKWLRARVEHEIHHRGPLYMYLGLLDVPTPALYGLTSEEVRARSEA